MTTWIMKAFKEDVAVMIANVAIISFRAAPVLQSMKIGQLKPLLKKPGANTKDFKNFRPKNYESYDNLKNN